MTTIEQAAAEWALETSFYSAVVETAAEMLAVLDAADVEQRFAPVAEKPEAPAMRRQARRHSILKRRKRDRADAEEQIIEGLEDWAAA